MGAFNYRVKDQRGRERKGVIEADSARAARVALRDQGLFPIAIEASTNESTSTSKAGFNLPVRDPMRGDQLALFSRQLATLIQAGMPLDEALATTASQSERASTKRLVLKVRAKLVEGHSLATALAVAPGSFNNLYRALIKVGESSGLLGEVLEQLADYLESRLDTQQKIASAMIYPIVLGLVATGIVVFLMTSVVPEIVGVFVKSKQQLPALTEWVIATSDFLVSYWSYLLIGIVVFFVAMHRWLNSEPMQRRWHGALLTAPVFGKVFRSSDSARFSATLGILVRSGVNLVEALSIAANVMNNRAMRDACSSVVERVIGGSSLFKSMQDAAVFPPLLVHMIGSGERSGDLAPMLDKAATHQERDLNTKLSAFMALLEPAMILIMGGIVMVIVFAVLMPMFEMNNMVKI